MITIDTIRNTAHSQTRYRDEERVSGECLKNELRTSQIARLVCS